MTALALRQTPLPPLRRGRRSGGAGLAGRAPRPRRRRPRAAPPERSLRPRRPRLHRSFPRPRGRDRGIRGRERRRPAGGKGLLRRLAPDRHARRPVRRALPLLLVRRHPDHRGDAPRGGPPRPGHGVLARLAGHGPGDVRPHRGGSRDGLRAREDGGGGRDGPPRRVRGAGPSARGRSSAPSRRASASASASASGCGPAFEPGAPAPVVWRVWLDPERRAEFGRVALRTGAFLSKWLAIAFLAESLMMAYVPASWVASAVGGGSALAIPLAAVVGVPTYLNGYAAIPLIAGSSRWACRAAPPSPSRPRGRSPASPPRSRSGPSCAAASSPSISASASAARCWPASSTSSAAPPIGAALREPVPRDPPRRCFQVAGRVRAAAPRRRATSGRERR